MEDYARTDLACEGLGRVEDLPAGSELRDSRAGGILIRRLIIRTAEAAEALGRPEGTYLTLACGNLSSVSPTDREILIRILSGELRGMAKRLTGKAPDPSFSVLAVGIGNGELTADAVGPMTAARLTATRHLRRYEEKLYRDLECCALSVCSPGVLGQTGIETSELIRSAVSCVSPDLVLIVDALAAKGCDSLASTIQLTDAGIEPGSGVGNHRNALTRESLGVPVLALGVPTVVRSSALVYDALERAGITEMDQSLRKVLENGRDFFVSPKECDRLVKDASELISESVSRAFTGGF